MSSSRAKLLGLLIIAAVVVSGAGLYCAIYVRTEPKTIIITRTGTVEKTVRNIVLVGWDGTQRNHLKEMISRGEVPNLVALASEGGLVDIDVTTGATDTKAGWTQILTGYSPEKTGVFSNSRYQPIPEGYTVFERLETFFGPENIVTVAIIGKKGHVDNDPPAKIPFDQWAKTEARQGRKVPTPKAGLKVNDGGQIVEENGVFYVAFPGKPYFNASKHMDLFLNGLGENEKVGTTAIQNLEKYKDKRFFFFIHFAQPDHVGHAYGENSRQYTDGIKSDDEWTGKIVAKLKELGLYDKTLVYITADHGFDEGKTTHSNAPYVFVATDDPKINRNGDRADITPTILKRFGLDLSKIEPPLDGTPLDEPAYVRVTCLGSSAAIFSGWVVSVSMHDLKKPVCAYTNSHSSNSP